MREEAALATVPLTFAAFEVPVILTPVSSSSALRRGAVRAALPGLALLVALWASACGDSERAAAARPTVVRVKTLAPERASSALRYSATIQEHESVELSFRVGGEVRRLLQVSANGVTRDVQEGDVVTRGTVLAELDTRDYERDVELATARLERARSEVPRAEANAERWHKELARLTALEGSGAVTVKQVDETRSQSQIADADLEGARHALETAEVELRQAQDRLSDCRLVAPMDGSIALKEVAVGQHVAAKTLAFRAMDVRTVRAVFGVPDLMLAGASGGLHVELGQSLDVSVQAYEGERFVGLVSKIAPLADRDTRTFLTEVTIDNAAGRLRPGMIATIRVGQERSAVLLPLTAVQRGQRAGDTAVYVVADEGGRKLARLRRVELGGVYDNQVEVLEASEARLGDSVVVTNAWRLDEGREVTILGEVEAGVQR